MSANKSIYFLVIGLIISVCISCSTEDKTSLVIRTKQLSPSIYDMKYEPGNWDHPEYSKPFESNGNHRIVIEVADPSQGLTQLIIPWRRSDIDPHLKDIVIIDAGNKTIIEKKQVLEVTNEKGHLVFEPNPGSKIYHIYYLPHKSTGSYYPKLHYISADKSSLVSLITDDQNISGLPNAKIISAQSIDDFNSFFPMEIIATPEEVTTFVERHKSPFYLFPEYREHPIVMENNLPLHWVKDSTLPNAISDTVFKSEYYIFQVGLFNPTSLLNDVNITFSDFKGSGKIISKENITNFNTSGVDLNGLPFNKHVTVEKGKVQAFWFGVNIPADCKSGIYTGQVYFQPDGYDTDTIFVQLDVLDQSISNHGDDIPENMSRLRWLNSKVGREEETVIKPFIPVSLNNKTLSVLGRSIELNEQGLPKQIQSYYTQEMTKLKDDPESLLSAPITMNVVSNGDKLESWSSNSYQVIQNHQSEVHWETSNSSQNFDMLVSGSLEYDGMLEYKIKLAANKQLSIDNIILSIPMEEAASEYILGLGYKGRRRPGDINWKWDVTKHQEGAWLGTFNKGIQFVLRDNNYERPLNTNFYQNKPLNLPDSWYNNGKGGINITQQNDIVTLENYSGPRSINKGDTLNFNIRFLITPFKLIDTKEHFNTRFVHKYIPVDSVLANNGTVVNVHHANEINPYINYPFYNIDGQKSYIDEAHSKGVKVKLYNTIRELSYKAYELHAMRSLGHEIFNDGEGGGHSWLQEHLQSNYHSAWHATRVNDAAILNKGNSRWTNYYIEGINWLAKNQEIDGLYLDDIAFSRETVKRIANVFSKHRDGYVIDLHSANQYNHRDGFINSAFLYMEHFPYVSRLWFGEYFEYDLGPDYWLTEVSGIPFGLTGEMLEKGGHPYRGMVYGMTTRVYGNYNPGNIWKLFDDFNIAESEMLGYWVDDCPVESDNDEIKSTVYTHPDKVLIAMGSWSDKNEKVKLKIDWEALGFNPDKTRIYSPKVEGLQQYTDYRIDQLIPVEKKQGLFLILEKRA